MIAQADIADASASRSKPKRSLNVNGEAGKDMERPFRRNLGARRISSTPYNFGNPVAIQITKCGPKKPAGLSKCWNGVTNTHRQCDTLTGA
jgi:hypothetical protein